MLAVLSDELADTDIDGFSLVDPLRRLLAVHRPAEARRSRRPDTPLARSALLTGTKLDPSLADQLAKEVATADRVDILCSFIKWSGLRLLVDDLRELASTPTEAPPRLRVIATSYMGATDPKAIDALRELPNTEIRISYDTKRTRLHAKAYIIHRDTGFGSAYIGSANVSRAALTEGLEWTSKLSQYELPHLWQRVIATFDRYWADEEFVPYHDGSSERLRLAIASERSGGSTDGVTLPRFRFHPYPFQEEILDSLQAERENAGTSRQLVVAATGTGKTMIAAFDYQRWAGRDRPPLLFVTHREEILRQAIESFRAVLRDYNFGSLLVGGEEPESLGHLFCSIQSYNSRRLFELDPVRFEYVVVDEFHHAEASSYQTLLSRIRPKVLLGLTATPERADGLDILHHFGGEPTAEIRLPDAIDRRLLCPFHYFGITDSEDLSQLVWQRGGYRAGDLDRIYTGNDARADLVVEKARELLLDIHAARAIGFCVSIDHAEFMAHFFNERGIASRALSARSSTEERYEARTRLERADINFLFVVDLYNEGVDIPEVDTVLFLRPTESLTVYLQQLGRGLRLHKDKECLTVLDFIGSQRREFRYAPRFRALSSDPARSPAAEVEAGFPALPAGCSIRLERLARKHVLDSIRANVASRRDRIVQELREIARALGRAPTIGEAIESLDITLDRLLSRDSWSTLLAEAAGEPAPRDEDAQTLARGVRRLARWDDPQLLRAAISLLRGESTEGPFAARQRDMLLATAWGTADVAPSAEYALKRLKTNPSTVRDIAAIFSYRLHRSRVRPSLTAEQPYGPLLLHAHYSLREVLIALGYSTFENSRSFREGVLHIPERRLDVFFVTLHKTEQAYSPTTMYEDYAIDSHLFHWQSQSTTAADSPTGRRYQNHGALGYTPLLFVRETIRQIGGHAPPYAFLGPADYISHTGSKPMSIIWRLRNAMPAALMKREVG